MARIRRIAGTFWLVPALCLLAAVFLAQALVSLDRALPEDYTIPGAGVFYNVGSEGARALLSSVGGAMVGVAGTAFSITISVIATASSTYGPRLVRNFMSDRKNQLVLGVLVSTFIYALLVVRTIKSPDADGGDEFESS